MGRLILFTKFTFILICFVFTSAVLGQNITNKLGTGGTFSIGDNLLNYVTLSQSTGNLSLFKGITLQNTALSGIGVIYKASNRFLHNYGSDNVFLGVNSGNFTLTGNGMTGIGGNCLLSNTTGIRNTGLGFNSLYSNTSGSRNVSVGALSLYLNTTGSQNTALGDASLYTNTTGNNNTGLGFYSLTYSTTGEENTATGSLSMYANTTGSYNIAMGYGALYNNTTGSYNTALGYNTLVSATTGNYNTAVGNFALESSSSLGNNTAIGNHAGSEVISGFNNTLLGYFAQPSSGSASNQVTLGNSGITSLRCNVQTISSLSDRRDKTNIKDLPLGIDFIMNLKPRQFNWDRREWYDDNSPDGSKMNETPTAGFIAQELDEVQTKENADWLNLVLKDNPEKLEATYGNLLPVMVKAIQELKTENTELKEKLAKFEKNQQMIMDKIEQMKAKDGNVELVKSGVK